MSRQVWSCGRRGPGVVIAAVVAALVLAACGAGRDVVVQDATPGRTTTSPRPTTPNSNPGRTSTTEGGGSSTTAAPGGNGVSPLVPDPNRPKRDYDGFLEKALANIQSFWETTYPQVYNQPYKDLTGGVYAAYPGVEGIPSCGRRQGTTSFQEVKDNAFYCPQGDFIAFDDEDLFPKIDAKYGPFVLGTILAHEWGHGIQARAGVEGATILLEQQADCFAGSWMAQLADGGGGSDLKVTDKEINLALAGMVTFSDQPGTSANDQQAHGSAFDRVGAFQDGFVNAAKKCATYPQNPPSVVEIPFTSANDAATGGNLPFDQIVPLATKDLDRFWAEVFQPMGKTWAPLAGTVKTYRHDGPYPACNGLKADDFKDHAVYCPSGDYIAYDQDTLSGTVNDIGDFAVGALLGNAYADAAQHRLALSTAGKDKSLQEDCFTGAWSASDLPRKRDQQEVTLSPGDLDEAVSAFLGFGTQGSSQSSDAIGTPFDRIASFRKGFFEGVKSCGLGG